MQGFAAIHIIILFLIQSLFVLSLFESINNLCNENIKGTGKLFSCGSPLNTVESCVKTNALVCIGCGEAFDLS